MKLKMFLLFILTFILVPCVGYAEDYYIYSKSNNESLSNNIINTFCGNDLSNCKWICNDGTELSGTLSPCEFFGGVEKVTAPGILDKIMEYPFGNTTIYQKMQDENYCPNTNNSDDICKSFRFENNGGGRDQSNTRVCYANMIALMNDSDNITFNITLEPNVESAVPDKLYFRGNDPTLGSSLTLDDTNKVVRYLGDYTNEFYFYSYKDKSKSEFIKKFKESYYKNNTCPTITFCLNNFSGHVNMWYAEFDSTCEGYRRIYYQTINTANGNNSGILTRNVDNSNDVILDDIEIKSCEDFFGTNTDAGKKLIDLIVIIKNIIFLLIPIIVIGFTTIDFAKAVLSTEDGMKKAQGRLFKRILIAVVVFLVPVILKVVLWIANFVWPSISTDLCGIL